MLSALLKNARLQGYVNWDDIEDRVRTYNNFTGWPSSDSFAQFSVKRFLSGYRRDLLIGQDVYIEVWIEKDALSSIFSKIAEKYTVPLVVCRGFASVSFLNDYKQRLSHYPDKRAVLLYFGDFDPSGVEMLNSMQTTLKDELHVHGIEFKRVALSKQDIYTYNLPHSPEALKKSDTRAQKHIEEFGELAVELDALRPDVLQDKIKTAIESELDMGLFELQQHTQREELDKLKAMKRKVAEFVQGF
jgi:hypothetical protein